MTEEEISQYKALKESDRKQVEKGLKLALLAALSAEKDKNEPLIQARVVPKS